VRKCKHTSWFLAVFGGVAAEDSFFGVRSSGRGQQRQ